MISPSLNPNEKLWGEYNILVPFRTPCILRVETSLVTSHTDAPQEPELESCYIKKTSYGGCGLKEAMSRRPRISLHI